MTCRHAPGDPSCSSSPNYVSPYRETPAAPDPKDYSVERAARIGPHLVLKVRYPSCRDCAFEGDKTMVFLDVDEVQALQWREIDPHFRSPAKSPSSRRAPSPAARFPSSEEGWADALRYAEGKAKSR